MAKRNRVITFVPIIALATLLAVSLQLNGLLMIWKIRRSLLYSVFGSSGCLMWLIERRRSTSRVMQLRLVASKESEENFEATYFFLIC